MSDDTPVTDPGRAGSAAASRNAMLQAEFEAERKRERNRPPDSPALQEPTEALRETFGTADETDEQREGRIAANWAKWSSYWCSGCQHIFADGEVIHRKRTTSFDSMWGPSWSHASACDACISKLHPSWMEYRRKPQPCEGGCGALVSSWGLDNVRTCSRRCAEIAQGKRRRVKHEPRACEVCGAEVVSKRADARFCCNAHRQRAYRERNSTPTERHRGERDTARAALGADRIDPTAGGTGQSKEDI